MCQARSVVYKSYTLIFVARFLNAMGFAPMNTAKNIILADWFFDSQLSFASNLGQAICRQVSFLNGVVTPKMATEHSLVVAF